MKIRRMIKGLVCFIAGSVLGLMLFAPWNQAAVWMAARISHEMPFSGIRIEINEASAEGIFNPYFTFSKVKANSPLISVQTSWIQTNPSLLKLITSGELRSRIYTGSGLISSGLTGMLSWRSASAEIRVGRESILFDNILVDGDLKVQGFIRFSKEGKITGADMSVTVPDKFDEMIKAASIVGSLPLKKTAPGEWRFKQ